MMRFIGVLIALNGVLAILGSEVGNVLWGWPLWLRVVLSALGAMEIVFGTGVFASHWLKGNEK